MNFIQIRVREKIEVRFLKEFNIKNNKKLKDLGLDKNLWNICFSSGSVYGTRCFKKVKGIFLKAERIRANRQRQGLSPLSKKVKKLEFRAKEYLRNEIGRILNKVVKEAEEGGIKLRIIKGREPVKGFANSTRYVRKMGWRYIDRKLSLLEEEGRIEVKEVFSCWSSLECPSILRVI